MKKRQHEESTNRDGTFCSVQDDSWWEPCTRSTLNARRQFHSEDRGETILSRTVRWPGMDQVHSQHGSSYDSTTCGTCRGPSVFHGGRVHRCGRSGHPQLSSSKVSLRTRTEPHKPLVTASEISQVHRALIYEEFGVLFPVYDKSTIECVSFVVIMQFFLCTAKGNCTANYRWHQWNRIKTS